MNEGSNELARLSSKLSGNGSGAVDIVDETREKLKTSVRKGV